MKRWHDVRTKAQLEAKYRRLIPRIRRFAKAHGYAIAVHGSMRRDLDIMAMPWTEEAIPADQFFIDLQRHLLGYSYSLKDGRKLLRGPQKPHGRLAGSIVVASLPKAFRGRNKDRTYRQNSAYIDISIMPPPRRRKARLADA